MSREVRRADRLVHQVIAGVLGEQRRGLGADAPARRLEQPRDRFQQRRLPRPVAPHQRDRLTAVSVQRHALQHGGAVVELDPHVLDGERGRLARASPRERPARLAPPSRRAPPRSRRRAAPTPRARSSRRASFTVTGAAARAGAREQLRRRRRARAGQPRARRLVGHDPAVDQLEHAISSRQTALEPVLGQHDRGPPLLVEPAQAPSSSSPATESRLRGGFVEQQQARAAGQRGGERDALQLAAAELVRRPVEQTRRSPSASAASSTPRATAGAAQPQVLQRERELGAHRPHHDLRLRVLEQRPRDRRDPRRPVLAGVQPAGLDRPRERPAMEVRHQPGGGAQQRRLARARPAGEQHQLPGRNGQRHPRKAPAAPPRDSDT